MYCLLLRYKFKPKPNTVAMCSSQLAIINACSHLKNQFDWFRSSGSGNLTWFRQSLPFSSSIKKTTKLIGVSAHRAQQPIDWSRNITVVPEAGTNVFGVNNMCLLLPLISNLVNLFSMRKTPKHSSQVHTFIFPPIYVYSVCQLSDALSTD